MRPFNTGEICSMMTAASQHSLSHQICYGYSDFLSRMSARALTRGKSGAHDSDDRVTNTVWVTGRMWTTWSGSTINRISTPDNINQKNQNATRLYHLKVG